MPVTETALSRPPAGGGDEPLVSICVPCLNEEVTIGEFVDWCHEGLASAGVSGEVVIVDSSTDRSPEIAEARGARVLRVPKRGLGRAYIDAIPQLRGKYAVLGDCDLTYDFREIEPFVRELDKGAEFVMGSRFAGYIEPDAMPKLHQYFGTPLTTWIFNRMYRTRFSDIHCGMRAMTLEALQRIDLRSQGWEYASEMILKATKLKLRTAEVPIRFYKDREGRQSQHVRMGWWSPWKAGWDNLKVMFLYAPELLLTLPGAAALLLGLLMMLVTVVGGGIELLGVGLDNHFMLLGMALSLAGASGVQLGVLAKVKHNLDPSYRERLLQRVSYDRGAIAAAVLVLIGVLLNLPLLIDWIDQGFELRTVYEESVLGLACVLLGFQVFAFTLLLQIVSGPGYREPDA